MLVVAPTRNPLWNYLKGTVAWDFRTRFFHKLVVPSPLIHTLQCFHHLLRFHRVIGLKKKICLYKTRKFLNLHDSIHGYFWISVYWNTKIQNFLCFKPRRFLNLHVLKLRDWKIWTVLPYNTSVFQYTEIFESLCFEIRRFKNLGV